jgi:sec-independent protein translocase protein TatB
MNLGFPEMAFIFFLALIIFGPKKLPEIGRQIGKALNEFKRASNEFRSQIETEISNLDTENKREVLPPSRPPVGSVAASSISGPVIEAEAQPVSAPVPDQSAAAKAPDA